MGQKYRHNKRLVTGPALAGAATNYLCDDDHTNMHSPAAYFRNKRRTGADRKACGDQFEDFACPM
jgi:TPP-dependent trihydroxycyclohexane-1,2-dione (THcHDO) dehydratase